MEYAFWVHKHQSSYRLVTIAGQPFPAQGHLSDWAPTRRRDPSDTNPDVARVVQERGYCLFRIGLTFDDLR